MSEQTYTITAVSEKVEDVSLDHGEFKAYKFRCKDQGDQVFELMQKPETAPPKIGDTFQATIKGVFQGVKKLKKVPPPRHGVGGGNNRPRDPQERASIERQVAAKVAADLLIALMEKAGWSPDTDGLLDQHARYSKRIAEGIAQ